MIARALAAVFRAYKRFLSPALPRACRFHPTCSEYAAEAVLAHGALKGTGLTFARILRCHPWSTGGFDPVPPAASPARPPRA